MKHQYFKNMYFTALFLSISCIFACNINAFAAEYAVVVNAENSAVGTQEDLHQQVQRIFLKQQTTWPNGIEAFPLDREITDKAHQVFIEQVLNMTEQEISSHWLRLKQQQGQTPPRAVGATSILLKLIGRRDGGMGIVNVDELSNIPPNVKVLFRFSD